MRISDWSSDVCSSDLAGHQEVQQDEVEVRVAGGNLQRLAEVRGLQKITVRFQPFNQVLGSAACDPVIVGVEDLHCLENPEFVVSSGAYGCRTRLVSGGAHRSEEHTSELQSLMRISYAVFCLKKKTQTT